MEVILKENYPSLGYVGDKVNVRGGYARNYLIPRGIALEANSRNAKMLAHHVAGITAKKMKLKVQAEEIGKKLGEVKLAYTVKIGGKGKAFGSITLKDIEKSITESGFALERKQLRLLEPIRGAGEYTVEVKLHAEVVVAIPVVVTAEKIEVKSEDAAEGGRRGRGRGRRGQSKDVQEQSEGDAPNEAAPEPENEE